MKKLLAVLVVVSLIEFGLWRFSPRGLSLRQVARQPDQVIRIISAERLHSPDDKRHDGRIC